MIYENFKVIYFKFFGDGVIKIKILFITLVISIVAISTTNLEIIRDIKYTIYLKQQENTKNKLLNKTKGYKLSETNISNVYYTEKDLVYLQMIQNQIDYYYILLLNDFNINTKNFKKADVIIYPDVHEFKKILNYNNITTMPIGVYYSGILNFISPNEVFKNNSEFFTKDKYLEKGPIIHELTHYITDIKTKGEFEIWFSEGIALFYEYKYMGTEWGKDLKIKSSSITNKQLKNNFKNLNQYLAYRRSFDIINDFVERNSEEVLQSLIY